MQDRNTEKYTVERPLDCYRIFGNVHKQIDICCKVKMEEEENVNGGLFDRYFTVGLQTRPGKLRGGGQT